MCGEKGELFNSSCSTRDSCYSGTPSNPAILGTCQSVLIRGVASFFRGKFALGRTFRSGLNTGVASFQEVQIRGSPLQFQISTHHNVTHFANSLTTPTSLMAGCSALRKKIEGPTPTHILSSTQARHMTSCCSLGLAHGRVILSGFSMSHTLVWTAREVETEPRLLSSQQDMCNLSLYKHAWYMVELPLIWTPEMRPPLYRGHFKNVPKYAS